MRKKVLAKAVAVAMSAALIWTGMPTGVLAAEENMQTDTVAITENAAIAEDAQRDGQDDSTPKAADGIADSMGEVNDSTEETVDSIEDAADSTENIADLAEDTTGSTENIVDLTAETEDTVNLTEEEATTETTQTTTEQGQVELEQLDMIAAESVTEQDFVQAATEGTCGQYAKWKLLGDGTLEITGKGMMDEYPQDEDLICPWKDLKSQIKKVTIADGIRNIGVAAFLGCKNMTSITIPDSVFRIGDFAFSGCKSLKEVIIPSSVTRVGDYTFSGCSAISNIELPNTLEKIGSFAFSGCSSLTAIYIPESVGRIGRYAFNSCESLISITIPEGITEIMMDTFLDCERLEVINIPNTVDNIKNEAFWGCKSLKSITIPEGVRYIYKDTFNGCESLTEVNLPNTIESINENAFLGCTSLRSITIPGSVKALNHNSFGNCTSLELVICLDGVERINSDTFANCNNLKDIVIPKTVSFISVDAFGDVRGNMYGQEGSTAQEYARKNGWNFVATSASCQHNYVGNVRKKATCKAEGTIEYICSKCDNKLDYVEKIPKTAHTFVEKITKATATANGKIVNTCSVCGTKKTEVIYYPKKTNLSVSSFVYNGKVQKPTLKVIDANNKTIPSSNYTVTFPSGCKNAGSYKITIKFKGEKYSQTKTKTYTITKASQTITGSNYTKTYGAGAFTLNAKRTVGDGKLSYSSSDKKVAAVTSAGKVTIKGVGKATITVTAAETTNYKKATKKITVTVKAKK